MKVTIIGAGAMGSLYAAFMAAKNHVVDVVDPWEEHINEIQNNGLKLDGPYGKLRVDTIKTHTRLDTISNSDIYIIATKSFKVEQVAKQLARGIKRHELVITIQNGLGSAEKVAKYINEGNIIIGVAEGFGSSIVKPGHVHHNAMNLIRLGEMKKTNSKRLNDLTNFWINCGFRAKTFHNIDLLIWEKFICNVTFSGPCTVFNCNLGDLMGSKDQWEIALGCMKEAYKIGMIKGLSFSFQNPVDYVLEFGRRMPNAKPSMLLDLEAKRLSEIDAINGMVLELGKKVGVETPFNQIITSLILLKEKNIRVR